MPVDQILGCFKTLVEEIQFRGQPVKLILIKFKFVIVARRRLRLRSNGTGRKI